MRSLCLILVLLIVTLEGCDGSNRSCLTCKEVGLNLQYSQEKTPTKQQKEAGLRALKKWKTAGRTERYWLADEIVAGKTLIGMTQKEVQDSLGEVILQYQCTSNNEKIPAGIEGFVNRYDVLPEFPTKESTCDLCAKYGRDGKVSQAYVDVNP